MTDYQPTPGQGKTKLMIPPWWRRIFSRVKYIKLKPAHLKPEDVNKPIIK